MLQEHIREYVNALGEKYNTAGKPRTITSTSTGQPVSVEGGNYGFLIDARGERRQLFADIRLMQMWNGSLCMPEEEQLTGKMI